jgi:hypothetical protein
VVISVIASAGSRNILPPPNKPRFPFVVLKPGERYRHNLINRFSAK